MPANRCVAETKQFLGGFVSEQFRHAFLFEIFGAKRAKPAPSSKQGKHEVHWGASGKFCFT
jgi:hypothetical protein